jgi:hypothetical protein
VAGIHGEAEAGMNAKDIPGGLFARKSTGTYGPAYNEARDGNRLQLQQARIRDFMLEGGWHTLAEISEKLESKHGHPFPEASISAQLRHLRKPRFGGYIVEKRRKNETAQYEYLLLKIDPAFLEE